MEDQLNYAELPASQPSLYDTTTYERLSGAVVIVFRYEAAFPAKNSARVVSVQPIQLLPVELMDIVVPW